MGSLCKFVPACSSNSTAVYLCNKYLLLKFVGNGSHEMVSVSLNAAYPGGDVGPITIRFVPYRLQREAAENANIYKLIFTNCGGGIELNKRFTAKYSAAPLCPELRSSTVKPVPENKRFTERELAKNLRALKTESSHWR